MTKTATKNKTATKTATKTKNITVHSDEIVTVHSDDLYKIAKTMEGMFKKINDLDNKISSRDISGRDIEEALSDISYKMGDADTIILVFDCLHQDFGSGIGMIRSSTADIQILAV